MKVEKTRNYKQFKKIKGNRLFATRHLKNLIASIAENNLLQYTPIIVNNQMEVIDGQHRLAAAEKLGEPIYFVRVPRGDLGDVILVNANTRAWQLPDYLESQIILGNKEYKTLKEYVERFNLPLGVSVKLLSGDKADASGHTKTNSKKGVISLFREGLFKVTNLDHAVWLGERLKEIAPYTEVNVWKDSTFINALASIYTKVKPSTFIDMVARSGIKISKKSKVRDYLLLFEDIYNFRKSAGRQKFY